MKLEYIRSQDVLYAYEDDNSFIKSWECRHDFFQEWTADGVPMHETLPDGNYDCYIDLPNDEPGAPAARNNGRAFGTFYVSTGDPRERAIHGGGSNLDDPFAPRQGWLGTHGCLRMQNEDGEELSQIIIDHDNGCVLWVHE